MSDRDNMTWLKGKKIAFCEQNLALFEQAEMFLSELGPEVIGLNSIEAMLTDLELRRYSTHRIYLVVFVSAQLARDLEALWLEITRINPGVAQTPLVLMASAEERKSLRDLMDKGYFRFCIS